MEEILEIRDGCTTPIQLLKSKAFAKFLNIYKKQFIKEFEEMYTTLKLKELRETHDSFIFTTLRLQNKNKNLFFL